MKPTRLFPLLGLAATVSGCVDMGLAGNEPAEDARHRPPLPLEAAVMAPDRVEPVRLIVDGRLWLPSGRPRAMRPDALRPIGAADGHAVHARRWDQPPYDALFVRPRAEAGGDATGPAGEWQEYVPVIGGSRRTPAP